MKIPGLKSSSILINWSLSYISILLIPVLISMAVYYASGNILKKEITHTNNQLLNQIKNAIDSRLQDVEKTGLQLSFNQNIRSLRSQSEDVATIASYNSVIRDLRVYKLSNSFADNFFIYLKDNRCAISSNSYLSEDYFMDNAGGYKEIDKNQWKQDILQENSTKFTPLLIKGNKSYCSAIAYTKPIFLGNSMSPKALLIITIENSKLLESINNIDLEDKSSIFVIDKNNVILSSKTQRELAGLIKYDDLKMDSGIIQAVKGKEKLTVSFASSDITDWKYVSIIPTKVFSEKNDFIRKLTNISILLSLVIGFLVMLLWVKLNYNPMGRLIKALSTSSGLINDKKVNEFKFIQEAINRTNDEKQKVLKDMRSQRTIVRTNLLVKLLKGKLNFDSSLSEMLLKSDIKFETEHFVVILFYIEQNSIFFSDNYGLDMSLKEKQELARFIISNIIEELTCQENYGLATEIDDMVACIVNMKNVHDEMSSMNDLLRLVGYASEVVRDKFKIDFKVSLSEISKTIYNLSKAYEEACEMLEYKKILGLDDLELSDNAQRRREESLKSQYYFPLQLEQKLINFVKAGDFESSQMVLNEIYEKNLSLSAPSLVVIKCLMFDLISTMFKTLNEINGFCDNTFLERLDPINRLTNCHTVFDMKRHLEDILNEVCRYIKDNRRNEHSQIKDKVVEFVNNNYKDINLNISMISDYIDITPAYLSKLFKEQGNISLLDYINKVRLERAKELLRNTKSNIMISQMR